MWFNMNNSCAVTVAKSVTNKSMLHLQSQAKQNQLLIENIDIIAITIIISSHKLVVANVTTRHHSMQDYGNLVAKQNLHIEDLWKKS